MTSRTPTRQLRAGLFWTTAFVATFGAWAFLAELRGAVVATGQLVYNTDGSEIEIRQIDGGPVAEILIEAGAAVKAGDVVARMDGDLLAVERRILEDRLFETRLRDLRLQSLVDGTDFPDLPPALQAAVEARPELARSVDRERAAHAAAKAEMAAVLARLTDAEVEAKRASTAARAIMSGMATEIAVIGADLESQQELLAKGLTQRDRVSDLERDKVRADNTLLQTKADAEAQEARVQTIRTEMERETSTRRSALMEELARTAETIPELEERLAGVMARQERLDIKAPASGHVNRMLVAAPGVVLTPGSTVATLVPDGGTPYLVAPIAPTQIDQVRAGQDALLRPMTRAHNDLELPAKVLRVGEGLRRDEATGATYYEVILEPDLALLAARGDGLVSGTPFEVAIQTTARTPMAYLMEPVQRSFRRAMRE